MLWFLRGLKRGVVTTRYPAELDEWVTVLPSVPEFHSALLTDGLAELLERTCPSGALRREPVQLIFDSGACTGCGRCVEASPGVVRSSGEFLLAAHSRRDLIKRIPIGAPQYPSPGSSTGDEP